MRFIRPDQTPNILPAEEATSPSPIPTQIVSSDEYMPTPQTKEQREVEARLNAIDDDVASKNGISRRRFFQTAAGIAASYYVMNQVYGEIFEASAGEATSLDVAAERSKRLKEQMVFDAHPHFIRDDPSPLLADPKRTGGFMWQRALAAKLG